MLTTEQNQPVRVLALELDHLGFTLWLCHLLARRPQTSHLTFLTLNFLIWKMVVRLKVFSLLPSFLWASKWASQLVLCTGSLTLSLKLAPVSHLLLSAFFRTFSNCLSPTPLNSHPLNSQSFSTVTIHTFLSQFPCLSRHLSWPLKSYNSSFTPNLSQCFPSSSKSHTQPSLPSLLLIILLIGIILFSHNFSSLFLPPPLPPFSVPLLPCLFLPCLKDERKLGNLLSHTLCTPFFFHTFIFCHIW